MKYLVIGGSYFLGKAFVNKALSRGDEVILINRGSSKCPAKTLIADRKNQEQLALALKKAPKQFDALVDFCGYDEGDIASMVEALQKNQITIGQYIWISTVDVLEHCGHARMLSEADALEKRALPGEIGAYIHGKVQLESEIVRVCQTAGIPYTILRPGMIYGPDNYAPREGIYFRWISMAKQILHPSDATGSVQLVYVEDVAEAICRATKAKDAFCEAFLIVPPEQTTYDDFADALAKIGLHFEKVPVSMEMIQENGIPLPFPLYKEESEWYDSSKAMRKLAMTYTSLQDGLAKTYQWYGEQNGYEADVNRA